MNHVAFFQVGRGRRAGLILAILVLIGGSSLGLAAILGDDIDIAPFVPEPGPDRVGAEAVAPTGDAVFARVQRETQIGDPGNQPGGEPERFGPGDAGVIQVPDDWDVLARDGDTLLLGNGDGVFLALSMLRVDATTPATQIVTDAYGAALSATDAAHRRTSAVLGEQPFGKLVTRSSVGYSALRTDAQGLVSVGGNVFAFVRDDGLALIVNPEVTPAEHWDARVDDWFPLWNNVVSNFAGASALA